MPTRPLNQSSHVILIRNQQQDGLIVFPALQLSYVQDCLTIERVGAETIKRVGAKGYNAAATNNPSSFKSRFFTSLTIIKSVLRRDD